MGRITYHSLAPLARPALWLVAGTLVAGCPDRKDENDTDGATSVGSGGTDTSGDTDTTGGASGQIGMTSGSDQTGTTGSVGTTGTGTGTGTDDFPHPNDGLCEEFGVEEECYTGPPETLDVGECERGMQVCEQVDLDVGEWSMCSDRPPSEELCNGRDDDCDGAIDEDLPNCQG